MTDVASSSELVREAPAITVDHLRRVNFAAAQNDVAILRSIEITNRGAEPLVDLRLELSATPEFMHPKTWHIDRIPPEQSIGMADRKVEFDMRKLGGLNEAEHGHLAFRLARGEQVLQEVRLDIELLARDEWGGLADPEMGQMLAAFVAPNDPAIAKLMKEASRILEQGGHAASLEGYQSGNPERVYMLAAAAWSAIGGLGLTYAEPPRSFELTGQKVRDPSRIVDDGLATCLDTTLLMSAVLEGMGLNSAVMLKEGHAFVGAWLMDRTFPHLHEPDVIEVRKAISLHEFIVMETTLLTHRPAAAFDEAVREARRHLREEVETEFLEALDIARARSAGIRPLASHRITELEETPTQTEEEPTPVPLPPPPDLGILPGELADLVDEQPATPDGRIERWQRKLLDLTLRNRLLNFADTKQTVPFLCPDVALLEDRLVEGEEFRIVSFSDEDPTGNRDTELHQQEVGMEISEEFIHGEMEKNRLCVSLPGRDMQARLTTLYRKAKSDMAEGGTNTLYLAAGFLRWKKSPNEKRSYRAPLVLLPAALVRPNAQANFRLRHHEDDARFNATLLEFLSRDFGLAKPPELLDELPTDDSGLDLPRIFRIMREAVREIPGFEVIDNEMVLSTFSFAKYLMWKDITERTDDLRENRLVKHLIDSPELPYPRSGGGAIPAPRDIDRNFEPRDMFTPLDADSSQLAAVMAAADGHDAVIIGPPGTGKSQTIANMIAHCLAKGKTVLFVAEKSAALDVVHRRLKAIGLADACLELHSNKADRRSVLTQLGAAWDRATEANAEQWMDVTGKVQQIRDELNTYVAALHQPGSHGLTVFDAIGTVAPIGDEPPFRLAFETRDAHDQDGFAQLVDTAETAARAFSVVHEVEGLESIAKTDWSNAWQAELLKSAEDLGDAAENLAAATDAFTKSLGQEQTDTSLEQAGRFGDLAEAVAGIAAADYTDAPTEGFEQLRGGLDELEGRIGKMRAERGNLVGEYDLDVIPRIPIDALDMDWRKANASMWPMSWLGKRGVRKLLQTYAAGGMADPERDLPGLTAIADHLTSIERSNLAGLRHFRGTDTEVSILRDYVDHAARFRGALDLARQAAPDAAKLDEHIEPLLREGGDGQDSARCARQLVQAKAEFDAVLAAYEKIAGAAPKAETLNTLVAELAGIAKARPYILDWTRWVEARVRAEAVGMMPLIEALEERRVPSEPDAARAAFEQAYMSWWLPLALDDHDSLKRFTHWEHLERIEKFRDLDKAVRDLAVSQIHRALAHGLPERDAVAKKSELGVLRHQLNLKRPSMPIRRLITEMPETFTKLAPCVLMSPLSIAQYLPSDYSQFDMVIFDEASQITTWDAVGAIARGRQSIIVGDPKQLPPTNFFGRTTNEEDADLEDYEQDLASILDEACTTGLPTLYLNWHYRSRDESLISFSNHHYYDDKLITFPSPDTSPPAVRLHKIDGVYGRGTSRTNDEEARAMVEFMVERLNAALKLPEQERDTLGAITFNVQQQERILDLLDAERRDNPQLEWFFDEAREEPTIVKNLENVQGDERDVMLFSITFGKDHHGKMSMGFGALNGDGGEKRLNVAVTRARKEMHVFSSITADMIDLGRTQARGVRDLRQFLDYAEHGAEAITRLDEGSLGGTESPFEKAVKAALEDRGWQVRTQIGVSGFRIDLGIVHPDRPGAYLAGVECDGATYHGSPTARDRDRVREGVLRGLGWEIVRIWSTEWFREAKMVCDRVDEELRELLRRSRIVRGGSEAEDARSDGAEERAGQPSERAG